MAKDPAFLFYSSDFITGVSDLTMEERGQYITLLCLHHQKGRLTKKAVSISCPNVSEDVISKFKIDEDGKYYNDRLETEAKKRSDHAEKQRQRAVDGWKKRKKTNATVSATAEATALPLEDESVNENRDTVKEESEVTKAEVLENFPFEQFWIFYDKKRGDKKKIEAKFKKLSERDKQQIFETLPLYVDSTPDKQFRKDPMTYINQKGWEHEIINTNEGLTTKRDGRSVAERLTEMYK